MSWYHGTFACGCEGRVNVIGPNREREWKVQKRFEGLCEKCYEKKMQEEREKANLEALEKTKEFEFEQLTGTEKQIAWANTIRVKMYEELVEYISKLYKNEQGRYEYTLQELEERNEIVFPAEAELMFMLDKFMNKKQRASFYIDNRDIKNDRLVVRIIKESLEKKDDIPPEVLEECIVSPAETKHVGTVVISIKESCVDAKYHKDDDFMYIVKKLGYKWNGSVWRKEIEPRMISVKDRAAELGNKLLLDGFVISIQDSETRECAVNGKFEREYDRWATILKSGNIGLKWIGRDAKLYNSAKRLTGAKWDSPYIIVGIEHYEEVLDFADVKDFGISKELVEAIESYKIRMNSTKKVNVKEAEVETKEDKLGQILETKIDILDDLKDE